MGWGKRVRGETAYLQTAIRKHGEEVGTPLPDDLEQRVTEVVVGKGRVYLLEVTDMEMHLHIHPNPTDAKTKEVKWWPIADVLASQWVRKETFNVLEDEVLPLMDDEEPVVPQERKTKRTRPDVVE